MKIPIVVLIPSVILIVLLEMGSGKRSKSFSKSGTKRTLEHGDWGSWRAWSSCLLDIGNCGRGKQIRRRLCNNMSCIGDFLGAFETRNCSTVCTFTKDYKRTLRQDRSQKITGPVRLTGALHTYEGRVEIKNYIGGWGTICDNEWDINDAKVVCRKLGFSGASKAYSNAYFGEGSGNIWISNVNCTGNESLLRECSFEGIGNSGCSHADDAGVACNE